MDLISVLGLRSAARSLRAAVVRTADKLRPTVALLLAGRTNPAGRARARSKHQNRFFMRCWIDIYNVPDKGDERETIQPHNQIIE